MHSTGWSDLLAKVHTEIFTIALSTTVIPVCFKPLVSSLCQPTYLNDYYPIAVTLIIIKCFRRLIMIHINYICTVIPAVNILSHHNPLPLPPTWTKKTFV